LPERHCRVNVSKCARHDQRPLEFEKPVGRPRSASPSEGSTAWHQLTQKALVESAFDHAGDTPVPSMVLSKQVG